MWKRKTVFALGQKNVEDKKRKEERFLHPYPGSFGRCVLFPNNIRECPVEPRPVKVT